MTDTKKTKWPAYTLTFCLTLILFCSILGTITSKFGTQLSEFALAQGQIGSSTVAPENLASVPESFRLSLRVEAPTVPVEEMTKTRAWSELQETASRYAKRLDLMERQMLEIRYGQMRLSNWVSGVAIASSFGLLASLAFSRRSLIAR